MPSYNYEELISNHSLFIAIFFFILFIVVIRSDILHGFWQPIFLAEWADPDTFFNFFLVIRAVPLSGFKDKVQYKKYQE